MGLTNNDVSGIIYTTAKGIMNTIYTIIIVTFATLIVVDLFDG